MDFSGGTMQDERAMEQQYARVAKLSGASANTMPTIRERLEERITRKRQELVNLEAALAALNPDIEKALDALARCGNF
jgi:hypothetical protein